MKSSKNSPAHVYRFGDVMIDHANFLVQKGDQLKALTPRAFDVLVYLIEQRGRVVEKQELFEQVWKETFVTDNALMRAVKEIRHALGDDSSAPRYIETVHKRGYRFIAKTKTAASPTSAVATNKTLAVLPFRPLVDEHRDAALELGMADTLIARLSSREMIVRPISSVRKYVNLEQDPLAAGRELEVDSVLDGSIQRRGNHLRVTVRLVGIPTGAALWAGTFDEKFTDIFTVQDAIAERVASALELPLSGEDKKRFTKRSTSNPEAYELYVKGRYHLNKLTPPEVQRSISYFEQAVAIDPSYALAYVGLADANRALALSVDLPATEFFPKSKAAAQKAIELDDTLAEAHASLGVAMLFYDWDFSAAENEYRCALELNPNSADAHVSYAGLFSVMGKYAKALGEIRRARELDPLNLRTNALEGQFLILAGQVDEGLARLHKTIELEPSFFLAHLFASIGYIKKGMYQEAVAAATRARDLSGGNAEAVATIGFARAMSGKHEEAKAVLDELKKDSTRRYIPPYDFALVYNGLGERDEVFSWLERGAEQRDPKMLFLNVGPQWNNLRADPRFKNLVKRIGLAE